MYNALQPQKKVVLLFNYHPYSANSTANGILDLTQHDLWARGLYPRQPVGQ